MFEPVARAISTARSPLKTYSRRHTKEITPGGGDDAEVRQLDFLYGVPATGRGSSITRRAAGQEPGISPLLPPLSFCSYWGGLS